MSYRTIMGGGAIVERRAKPPKPPENPPVPNPNPNPHDPLGGPKLPKPKPAVRP